MLTSCNCPFPYFPNASRKLQVFSVDFLEFFSSCCCCCWKFLNVKNGHHHRIIIECKEKKRGRRRRKNIIFVSLACLFKQFHLQVKFFVVVVVGVAVVLIKIKSEIISVVFTAFVVVVVFLSFFLSWNYYFKLVLKKTLICRKRYICT